MVIKASKTEPALVKETMEKAVAKMPVKLAQRIYIGPNTLQLAKFTVIEGEMPAHIQVLAKKCPSIEKLFVPVDKFTALESNTKTKGTIEYRRYQEVLEYFAKKERE